MRFVVLLLVTVLAKVRIDEKRLAMTCELLCFGDFQVVWPRQIEH